MIKKKLISIAIPIYILNKLLDFKQEDKSNTLNTYEGACTFLVSVAPKIDKRYKFDSLSKSAKERCVEFEQILERLEGISSAPDVDKRISILI